MKKKLKKNRTFGVNDENASLMFFVNYEEKIIDVLDDEGESSTLLLNAKTAKWLGERLIKYSLELIKK